MCITQVTAWQYGGKNYDTEIEAVTAALEGIGLRIVKDHAHNPLQGLIEHHEALIGLLDLYRLCRAEPAATPTAEAKEPEKAKRGPEVVSGSLTEAYNNSTGPIRAQADRHIAACGFRDFRHFLNRGVPGQHHELEFILGMRPVKVSRRQINEAYANAASANMPALVKARDHIKRCGFADINAFLERASDKQMHELETILGLRDDED